MGVPAGELPHHVAVVRAAAPPDRVPSRLLGGQPAARRARLAHQLRDLRDPVHEREDPQPVQARVQCDQKIKRESREGGDRAGHVGQHDDPRPGRPGRLGHEPERDPASAHGPVHRSADGQGALPVGGQPGQDIGQPLGERADRRGHGPLLGSRRGHDVHVLGQLDPHGRPDRLGATVGDEGPPHGRPQFGAQSRHGPVRTCFGEPAMQATGPAQPGPRP